MAEVARMLEVENERLRDENAKVNREVAKCHEILAVLVEATGRAEEIHRRVDCE